MVHLRTLAVVTALAAAALPAATLAQATPDAPPPVAAPPPGPPPSYAHSDESIHGRVATFDGAYNLQVRDDRGFVDNVQLHQGTVINPTGVRLAPGMGVTIYGVNSGSTFTANEIDTPYTTYGAVPVYPYGPYGYAYPYPYPVYGYPFGPTFSLGIGFGPHFHRR